MADLEVSVAPDLGAVLDASAAPDLGAGLEASALFTGTHNEIASTEVSAAATATFIAFVGEFRLLNTVRRYYLKAFQYTLTAPRQPEF
jgi:hypothetical protein